MVGVVGSHVDSYAPAEDVQAVDAGVESYRGCDGGSDKMRLVVVVETEDDCYHGDGSELVQLVCRTDCHTDGKHLVCRNGFGKKQFA